MKRDELDGNDDAIHITVADGITLGEGTVQGSEFVFEHCVEWGEEGTV